MICQLIFSGVEENKFDWGKNIVADTRCIDIRTNDDVKNRKLTKRFAIVIIILQ